jgi:hypothetical protein
MWILAGALAASFAIRAVFTFAHRDPDSLWYDYERRGARFQLARALDYLTFLGFSIVSVWLLWDAGADSPYWLAKFALAWFGWSLLARFQVHHFPRMNRPGLYREAQMNLVVNLIVAVLSTAAMTGIVALVRWWRG